MFFKFYVVCLKQTGDIPKSQLVGSIPVSVRPTSSSPTFSYLRLTLPTVQPGLKQTETIGAPGCTPVQQEVAAPLRIECDPSS